MGYGKVTQIFDNQQANAESSAIEHAAAYSHHLYVVVPANLDVPGGDTFTVQMQISPSGETDEWVVAERGEEAPGTTTMELTQADVAQEDAGDKYVGYIGTFGFLAPYIRLELLNFNDNAGGDLYVDAYLQHLFA